jgi:hypothetical protein
MLLSKPLEGQSQEKYGQSTGNKSFNKTYKMSRRHFLKWLRRPKL